MILETRNSFTGLPHIKETRASLLWRALPRKIQERANALEDTEETAPWWPRHHEWDGHIPKQVRCWKCGTPLKGWRMALQSIRVGYNKDGQPITQAVGNPILIAGKPAVAFLPYPHLRETLVEIRWPKLNQSAVFNAQHCADCTIAAGDLDNVVACYLAGMDANLMNAWNHKSGSTVTPDRWATYLYRWGDVEPVGLATPEGHEMTQKIPAPGELLTAAQLLCDLDEARRSAVPAGVVLDFKGKEVPPGWVQDGENPGKIVKL